MKIIVVICYHSGNNDSKGILCMFNANVKKFKHFPSALI